MIRRLIILLLIVGCVFADTIVYKKSLFISDTLNNVILINSDADEAICYSINNKIDCLECWRVVSIVDSSNSNIEIDCNIGLLNEIKFRGIFYVIKKYKVIKRFVIPTTAAYFFIRYIIPLEPIKY